MQNNITNLQKILFDYSNIQEFDLSWYLYCIEDEVEISYNDNILMPSSSIRKISILLSALSQARQLLLDFNKPIKINHTQVETSDSSGCIQFLHSGVNLTFKDLLTLMIIVSDNIATEKIINLIGLDTVNNYCREINLRGTFHEYAIPTANITRDSPIDKLNRTTAKDTGYLLKSILKGANNSQYSKLIKCTNEDCMFALNILSAQQDTSFFQPLLPIQAHIANKLGLGVRNCGDAGIIYFEEDPKFILVILTDNLPLQSKIEIDGYAAASKFFANFAKLIWEKIAMGHS